MTRSLRTFLLFKYSQPDQHAKLMGATKYSIGMLSPPQALKQMFYGQYIM